MNEHYLLKYPAAFLAGFAVTLLLTPVARELARRTGFVQRPGARRIHATAIPLGGGAAVFLGFHAACAVVFLVPWAPFAGQTSLVWWLRLLSVSGVLLAVGLVDDRWVLPPLVKFAGQAAAAGLAYGLGMRVGNVLGVPLPPAADLGLTLLWFLVFINAFNLIDGADGLASGLAMIAAVGVGASLILRHQPADALMLLGLAGACLAFLRYNFHPATVFLGDAGAMFLGLVLAALSLGTSSKGTALAAVGVPLLAVGIPVFDAVLAIWRRSARRFHPEGAEEESALGAISSRDTDHIHHRLIRRGLSQRQVAVWLYVLSAGLAVVGLASLVFRDRALGIFLVAFVVGAYVVIRHLAWIELWDTGTALLHGLTRPNWRNRGLVLYPLIDAGILTLSLVVSTVLTWSVFGGQGDGLRGACLRTAPLGVGIPFLTLVAVKTYSRVWSLARISEFVLIAVALLAGILLSLGVRLVLDARHSVECAFQTAVHAGLSLPLVLTSRIFFRVVQDLMGWLGRIRGGDEALPRVALYGAGPECTLFLREWGFRALPSRPPGVIAGIFMDDTYLRGRYVHGHRVLGGIDEVEHYLRTMRIQQVIVVSRLEESVGSRLVALAEPLGVRILQWGTHLRPWTLPPRAEPPPSGTDALRP